MPSMSHMKFTILRVAGFAAALVTCTPAAAQFGLQPAQALPSPKQQFGLRPTQALPPPQLQFAAPGQHNASPPPARTQGRAADCKALAAQMNALSQAAMSPGLAPAQSRSFGTPSAPAGAGSQGTRPAAGLLAPGGASPLADARMAAKPPRGQQNPDDRRAALEARYRQLGCGR
ncbi:hypothetical protein [Burkholderia alba]|uniref:hypothetical protein n=1 Tax=Burkholderia alba TaxID=2683677 RepID=UPI002B05BBCA|nr:hypothetical protein [Burkholderia alba]